MPSPYVVNETKTSPANQIADIWHPVSISYIFQKPPLPANELPVNGRPGNCFVVAHRKKSLANIITSDQTKIQRITKKQQ